jgi:hypothetical protein
MYLIRFRITTLIPFRNLRDGNRRNITKTTITTVYFFSKNLFCCVQPKLNYWTLTERAKFNPWPRKNEKVLKTYTLMCKLLVYIHFLWYKIRNWLIKDNFVIIYTFASYQPPYLLPTIHKLPVCFISNLLLLIDSITITSNV